MPMLWKATGNDWYVSHIAVSLFVHRDQSYICSKPVDSEKKKNLRKKPEAQIIPNYLQKAA